MTKEQIEKAVNDYIGYEPEVDEGLGTKLRREAFGDGAEWRISSVWHDAGEKPEFDSSGQYVKFLVLYKNSECGLVISNGESDWTDILDLTKFVKWAYLCDFIPDRRKRNDE